jgi:putative tricarboxylic transport membrane protein
MFELALALTNGWVGVGTAIVLGTLLGFIIGLTPGIGGRIGIILLIPVAALWDPLAAAAMLFSMHAVIHTSSSITAIAFALPQSSSDAATVIDGYPLARMGRAGEALGASLSASALGGALGALAFLACIPIARILLAWFGPPEFLVLSIAGLTMVATLAGGKIAAGLLVGVLGLLFSTVGRDVMTGASRFTFGQLELIDGLNLAAFIGGMFAIPEILSRFELAPGDKAVALNTKLGDVWRGMFQTLKYIPLVIRSSIYGIGVGIMPGVGSSVAVWMSYEYAARTIKSEIPFGQGAIAGVIGPEAANNSKEGGAMVPTLFFGIPGSSIMALMLVALQAVGLGIGPTLLTTNIHVSFVLAATILLSNLVAVPMFFAVVPWIVRLTALRRDHMVPLTVTISLLTAMMLSMNLFTLGQFVLGCAFGILLKGLGWQRAPFLLGYVLGPILEASFIQTSQIWGWSMFLRPASLIMIAIFGYATFRSFRRRGSPSGTALGRPDTIAAIVLLAVFTGAFVLTQRFPEGASPAPSLISVAGILLSGFVLVRSFLPQKAEREPLEKFNWLGSTVIFCAAVPFAGLILASAVYTIYVLSRMRVRIAYAVLWGILIALLELGLLSLSLDIRAEPLISGWLLWPMVR